MAVKLFIQFIQPCEASGLIKLFLLKSKDVILSVVLHTLPGTLDSAMTFLRYFCNQNEVNNTKYV